MSARPGSVRAVLLDLDGTLADTAPDLGGALNRMRAARGLDSIPLERLRPVVSHGARGMLRVGFGLIPEQDGYEAMREEFLELYLGQLCVHTRLFDGMEQLLERLERDGRAWGIVTNKLHRYTQPLIEALGLAQRAACVISGDTTPRAKPHPDPLLEAARRMEIDPRACLYVGDDERDVQAARAANMTPVVALWGYLGDGNPPEQWGAELMTAHPLQLTLLL